MKVLQINTVFPEGSTGKIVRDLDLIYREQGIESLVVYGHGTKTGNGYIRLCPKIYTKFQALRSRLTGVMYGGCYLSTRRLISIIKKEKPDVVHLHCLNGNFVNIYDLLSYLKQSKTATILTNHAEFMYTANCGHSLECDRYMKGCGSCPRLKKETKSYFFDRTHESWIKMNQAFEGFDALICVNVSPWLKNRAEGSTIQRGKQQITILNGIDTSVFQYHKTTIARKRRVVFHATANFSDAPTDIKGGIQLIKLAERMPDVDFIVAGKHPKELIVPPNIELLGEVRDQKTLAQLYSNADLTVITSKKETFSMVVAESLCSGTPVVGFEAGAPELIAIPEYSCFVEQGNIAKLESAVIEFLNKEFDKATVSDSAKNYYSKEKMAQQYLSVYDLLCRNE